VRKIEKRKKRHNVFSIQLQYDVKIGTIKELTVLIGNRTIALASMLTCRM